MLAVKHHWQAELPYVWPCVLGPGFWLMLHMFHYTGWWSKLIFSFWTQTLDHDTLLTPPWVNPLSYRVNHSSGNTACFSSGEITWSCLCLEVRQDCAHVGQLHCRSQEGRSHITDFRKFPLTLDYFYHGFPENEADTDKFGQQSSCSVDFVWLINSSTQY